MLLSSLSILMGAILVPSDYLWVYSTHIILTCLYLICSKRLIVLFLTLLSLIFVINSEFLPTSPLPLQTGYLVWVDFEKRLLIYEKNEQSKNHSLPEGLVSIVYVSNTGQRKTIDNFFLTVCDDSISYSARLHSVQRGEITSILLPDKQGPWWLKQLYIKKHAAQLNIRFLNEGLHGIGENHFSLRDQLFNKLDEVFGSFHSWRFSKALLLGQDDLWSERDTWIIRTLGLAHLFVVSGLHTGFMFAIGCLLSKAVWQLLPNKIILSGLTRWQCDVFVIMPLLFMYAYITNWGEPVVRASIMLSVYLCARMLAIKASPYGIITLALWLVLLANPRAVLSPGLWLSFSMVYLLIGYCQTSTKLPRLFMVQIMLSTASMVLILGWQEAISSASILVNVVLIPFAAFLWFPIALLSCAEALLIGSAYSYQLLDAVLYYIIMSVEWTAFQIPLLFFESFTSSLPRWIMLLLIGYWVFQSPLKRGVFSAIGIWCVLFLPMLVGTSSADVMLMNRSNKLIISDRSKILIDESWAGADFSRLMFGSYLDVDRQHAYMLAPHDIKDLTAQSLLDHDIKWIMLKREVPLQTTTMLEALNVDWLVIPNGESLAFHFQNNHVLLRHSSCIYSFFLLKSDTCKRVEKLESVLNYLQT
ncbi:ComEC/Rec2 family competence protein [Marinomonas rhizomae]|uniref:Competence protein ComEC n=1 Tax=Marinomonas rhizomae TaxID=491948 RepID=A0A366JCE4_9GAMM|nr:ComEC/Rec2 family competence protein [Marinomonas rhizomae]RBP84643.1 competence protein ComEC [Marinomonas rhizomae]RNF75152.1 ComEC/Rec2 family competence protein [Marinomonas rhizomae]